jgi:NTP pyrophosphatase (non-canonical NTP hydrolase)
MDFNEYQKFTKTTAIYPSHHALIYLTLGLASEAGEVSGVVKKWVRGDHTSQAMQDKMKSELGDVCWYIARLADELSIPLSEILEANKDKLIARQQANTLKGDGDDR